MKGNLWPFIVTCSLLVACGGSKPAAHSASDEATDVEAEESSHRNSDEASSRDDSSSKSDSAKSDRDSSNEDGEDGKSRKAQNEDKPSAEPQFTENMSVDEATRAVPTGIERRNMDQETLGKPLQDLSVYEPCKPGSAKVKLKVAVWDGKAVGIDVTTAPKSDKLASCIRGKVSELKWDKKVKSLNTIEYQF